MSNTAMDTGTVSVTLVIQEPRNISLAAFKQDVSDVQTVIELAALMAQDDREAPYVGLGNIPGEVKISRVSYGSPVEVGILIAGWSWMIIKGLQGIATVVETLSDAGARRAEGRAADAAADRSAAEAEKFRAEADEIRQRTSASYREGMPNREREFRDGLSFDDFIRLAGDSLPPADARSFGQAMKTPTRDPERWGDEAERELEERRELLERLARKGFLVDTSNLPPR